MAPPGGEHGDIASILDGSLGAHVRRQRLGRVFVDTGFLLATDPDTVRAPNVAFVRREPPEAATRIRDYIPGAPDLAIEVISPNDLYTEVAEKVAEYLEHGARLVLVVNPRRPNVAVHRPDQPVRVLTVDDVIDGEDVVPGWSLPVRELFDES
ncbi:MAG: Uma2 family endonuclease [Chloroflexota bacterium]|nr:Uma2 family endonuclease [Chloroflexota bacterium]